MPSFCPPCLLRWRHFMPYSRKRLPGYGETMNPKRSRQLAHSWHRPAFSYTIVAVESCSWYAKCYFTELTLSLCHRIEDGTDQPIAFALRSLSPPEKNYAQLDCEALTIFYGVRFMCYYVLHCTESKIEV